MKHWLRDMGAWRLLVDARPGGAPPHRPSHYIEAALLVGLLATFSMAATGWPGGYAVIWFVNPVLLALLLRAPGLRPLPTSLLCGAVIALVNAAFGIPFPEAAGRATVNIAEILVSAWLIKRFVGGIPRFDEARNIGLTVLIGVILVPFAGALVVALAETPADSGFLRIWSVWFASGALGMLILLPVLLDRLGDAVLIASRRRIEAALIFLLVLATALFVFFGGHGLPLLFLVFPVAVLATFRFDWAGAALAQFIVAAVAIQATRLGYGRIDEVLPPGHDWRLLFVQLYLAMLAATVMPLGAALATRRRAYQEEAGARAAANAAMLAKSRFLASMSHELRTPLNAVLGFAQLMELDGHRPLDPVHRDYVGHIVGQGKRLLEMISDLLEQSRIDAGDVTMRMEAVDIRTLLAELERPARQLADERSVRLALTYPFAPLLVMADHGRLLQVMTQFISNAVKYNRPGGEVRICTEILGDDRIRLRVEDSGFGIAPEAQQQMFDPFNRLGREQGDIGGAGVGLAIAKQLSEMMGGMIGLQSRVGEGTSIWIELPRAQRPALAAVAATRPRRLPSLPKGKLLYIEDNPSSLVLMTELFAELGELELITETNGARGLTAAHRHRPALILTDMDLPDMSGVLILERLRADPATRHIPVIGLGADGGGAEYLQGEGPIFDAYLTKPVILADLLRILRVLLDPRRPREARLSSA